MSFKIGDYTYTLARPMNAINQNNLLARIMPLFAAGFGEFVPLMVELHRTGMSIASADLGRLSKIATPVSVQLAQMTDADRTYVYAACLACVDRKRDSDTLGWAPIWSSEAGVPMFDDINKSGFLMLRITLGVLQETYSAFFSASLSFLSGEAAR